MITGSIIPIGYKCIQTSISILAIHPCLFSCFSYVLEINIITSSPLHFSRGTYVSSQVSRGRAHGQRHLPIGLVHQGYQNLHCPWGRLPRFLGNNKQQARPPLVDFRPLSIGWFVNEQLGPYEMEEQRQHIVCKSQRCNQEELLCASITDRWWLRQG